MKEILSQQFRLDTRDFINGLIMAVLTPIVPIVYESINAGTLTFNWKAIAVAAVGGMIGYLVKNFLAPTKVIVQSPSEAKVDSLKQ